MKHTACLLFTLAWLSLSAQSHLLHHYSVGDGLPNSTVYDAWQDAQGFIWFGTDAGLSRFGGTRFKNFTTADGLPANSILLLEGDTEGRLLLGCFNKKPAIFQLNGVVSKLPDNISNKLNFALGYANFYKHGRDFYLFDHTKVLKLLQDSVEDLSPDPHWTTALKGGDNNVSGLAHVNGEMLFLTNSGLYRAKKGSLPSPFHFFVKNGKQTPLAKSPKCFGNFIFTAVENRLTMCKIHPDWEVKRVDEFVFEHPIERIFVEEDGRLWAQLQFSAAVRLDYAEDGFGRRLDLPEIETLSSVLTDREGVVWLTTIDNGVFSMPSDQNFVYSAKHGLPFPQRPP